MVAARRTELPLEPRRNKWKGIDLSVRMGHGHPDYRPLIFKNQNVADSRRGLQFREAMAPKLNQLDKMIHRKLRQRGAVVGMVEDDVTLPV